MKALVKILNTDLSRLKNELRCCFLKAAQARPQFCVITPRDAQQRRFYARGESEALVSSALAIVCSYQIFELLQTPSERQP